MRLIPKSKLDYVLDENLPIILSIYSESIYLATRYINFAVPRINFKVIEVGVKSTKIL